MLDQVNEMKYTGPRLLNVQSLLAIRSQLPAGVFRSTLKTIQKAQRRADAAAEAAAAKKAAAEAKREAEKAARRKAGALKAAATKAAKKAAVAEAAAPPKFAWSYTAKIMVRQKLSGGKFGEPFEMRREASLTTTAANHKAAIESDVEMWADSLDQESDLERVGIPFIKIHKSVAASAPTVTKSAVKMKAAGALFLDGEEKHDFDTGMGCCVFDWLVYRYGDVRGCKKDATMERLVEILGTDALETGVSADDLVPVCDVLGCRMYALDETQQIIKTHEPTKQKKNVPPLIFRVKNNHFYPITTENMSISQYGSGWSSNAVQVAKKDRIVVETPVELVQLEDTEQTRTEQMVQICNEQQTEVYGRVCPPIVMNEDGLQSFTLNGTKYYWAHDANIDVARAIAEKHGRKYCGESVLSIVAKLAKKLDYNQVSTPNPHVNKTLQANKNRAHYGRLTEDEFPADAQAYDIGKCFAACLMNPEEDWMLIQPEDEWMPYSGAITWGLYAVWTRDIRMLHGDGVYSSAILKRAAAAGVRFTVQKQLIPGKRLPRNYFAKLINAIIKECGGDMFLAKPLINQFIGSLGRTKFTRVAARMDTDANTVWTAFRADVQGVPFVTPAGDYYVYGRKWSKEFSSHNLPMWIQVLDNSNIRLFDMIEASGGELLGRKTDCAVLRGGSLTVSNEIGGYRHSDVPKMGVMKSVDERAVCSDIYEMPEWNELPITSSSEVDAAAAGLVASDGLLILGAAGTGKTYLAKGLAAAHSGPVLKCAFTNMAARNIGGETIDKMLKIDKDRKICLKSLKQRIGKGTPLFIVDEVSMIDPERLSLLCEVKRGITGSKFVLLGDVRQLAPVGYDNDFFSSSMVQYLAGSTRIELTVRQRYDAALGAMADAVVAGQDFVKRRGVVMAGAHLCCYNATRKRLNALLNEKRGLFVPEGEAATSQDVWIHEGLPVMAVVGRKGCFVNGQRFVVTSVGADITMTSEDEEVTVTPDEFQAWFVMAYAMTVHKAQGQTITGPITIHDSAAMDARMLYTALTRGTAGDQMWFAGSA